MKNFPAFSLLELLITCVMIGVIATMAISPVLQDLPQHKVNNDIMTVEQALTIAKSLASKVSGTVIVDFSQATSNNGDNGGLIQIKDNNGTMLKSFSMNKNVLYNSGSSTIANNEVWFNFKGQPMDSSGSISGFTSSSNTIVISYCSGGNCIASDSLEINPLTGSIDIN